MEQVASPSTSSLNQRPRYERSLESALSRNRTCLLVGVPGVGKTYTVNSIAQKRGWRVFTLLASLRDPVDFMGLPMRDENGMVYAAPAWAKKASSSDEPVVLFFDEIDKAPPVVQGACLRIATERVVGDDVYLGDNTRIVFAANPAEFGGFDIVDPLVSRVRRIWWDPSPSDMAQAIASATIELAQKLETEGVSVERANRYGGIISAFVTRPGTPIGPPKNRAARQDVWASPRSLTECAVSLAAIPEDDMLLRNDIIIQEIGVAAGTELITFMDNFDLPDPEDVLAGLATINVNDRLDRVAASLTALVGAVAYNCTIDRWAQCVKVLDTVAATAPDMVVSVLMRAIEIVKDPKNNLSTQDWYPALADSHLDNLGNLLHMTGAV